MWAMPGFKPCFNMCAPSVRSDDLFSEMDSLVLQPSFCPILLFGSIDSSLGLDLIDCPSKRGKDFIDCPSK